MVSPLHSEQSPSNGGVHVIQAFEFSSEASRLSYDLGLTEIGKVARQTDDNSFWISVGTGSQWIPLASSGSTNFSSTRIIGDLSVTGTGSFALGMSGSHTKLADGTSAFVGSESIIVSSASNGQVSLTVGSVPINPVAYMMFS